MRLDDQRESRNIEHARNAGLPGMGRRQGLGFGAGGGSGGGLMGFLLPLILSKFGIVGVVVAIGILFAMNSLGGAGGLGGLDSALTPASAPGTDASATRPENATESFVAKVLATTEDSWHAIFAERGARYVDPTLVLFSGQVSSACGMASAAVGPFYCPADRKVYLDISFFDELADRFGAPGDFAAAYVIAHEVGHHVQNLLGTSAEVQKAQRAARNEATANALSVRLELQADCYAGVWAARNRALLDQGDFAEGVRAAQAIGDDTLQREARGQVVPDSFTHGTSDQRIRWLTRGFEGGTPDACDTFTPAYNTL